MVSSSHPKTNGNGNAVQARGAYEQADRGFTEYWYPVCCSGDITETPKSFTLLGEPVAIVRRDKKAYALKDECPHRGTQFSMINTRKNHEFPGTCTITCPYHGWTYDLKDGRCVAVISEGPESPVPKSGVRVKTYPIEERRGLIWIWMGETAPVPVEDDIPNLMLDPKAVVKGFYRVKWGNWRFHAENVAAGHAQMIHKSTLRSWFGPTQTPQMPGDSYLTEDKDGKGIITAIYRSRPQTGVKEFEGLGEWHAKPRWQRLLFGWLPHTSSRFGNPVQEVRGMMLMLPGLFRVPNFPNIGYMYYEWYVPVDEENYIYFQTMCFWPKNWLDRIRWELKYYFWDRPTGPVLFNNQDAALVGQTTKYFKRTGNMRYLTKISKNDEVHVLWRKYCDEEARVVGTAHQVGAPEKAIAEPAMAATTVTLAE